MLKVDSLHILFMRIAKPRKLEREKVGDRHSDWFIELKYDGTRHNLKQVNGKTVLENKRGNNKTRHFPEITEAIELTEGTVLDGETIVRNKINPHGDKHILQRRDGGNPVIDKNGNKNFKQKLKMKEYPATFVAFDVLKHEGEDVRSKSIEKRRNILESIVNSLGDKIQISERYDSFSKGWSEVTDQKMEGLVLKKPDSSYPDGRTGKWLKVKNIEEVVRTIHDYEEHNKGVTAITEKGDRVTVNGSQSEDVKKLVDNNGSVECEISCLEKTKNGSLREPTWKRIIQGEKQ